MYSHPFKDKKQTMFADEIVVDYPVVDYGVGVEIEWMLKNKRVTAAVHD